MSTATQRDPSIPPAQEARRNRDIEVLRAFAVMGVLTHHLATLLASIPGVQVGFGAFNLAAGVDLFFVISGFVIGRSLLPRLQSAGASGNALRETAAFWVKRIFRLWPTAWFWLAIILLMTAFNFQSDYLDFSTNVDAAVAGVLNIANFRFADSFANYPYGASFHYWTLSLEEQFYLLLPVVALLSRKTFILVGMLVALIVVDQLRPFSLLTLATRGSALLLGVLLAIWSLGSAHRHLASAVARISRWLLLPIALASIALVSWIAGVIPISSFLYFGFVALAAGVCVLLASFDLDMLQLPGPVAPLLQWIGSRSYAIYVIHVPVFIAMNAWAITGIPMEQLSQPYALAAMIVGSIALVMVFAELNFRLIETPIRKAGVRLAASIATPRVRKTTP